MSQLNKTTIEKLFKILDKKLSNENIIGELYLVGGAVMCLVHNARPSTKDIDAYFEPSASIRKIVLEIAEEENLEQNWLNDAVKGYLNEKKEFVSYLNYENLKIFVPTAEYLLAMKCLAFRIGAEFSDENDIRYLLRFLNIENYQDAIKIISSYYPLEKFPQKTLYALEEMLQRITK